MTRQRSGGYALLLAICAISLAGAALFVLACGSRSLLLDADQAYLEACTRNLRASAAAWAQQNAGDAAKSTAGMVIDVERLDIPDGSVRIFADATGTMTVETQCRRGRLTMRRSACD